MTITVTIGFPVTRYRASFDAITPVLAAVALVALWERWRPSVHAVDDTEPAGTPARETAPANVAG